MDFYRRIKDQHRQARVLLHEFYKLLSQWSAVAELQSDSIFSSAVLESNFLEFAACRGLWKYVDEALINAKDCFVPTTIPSLLWFALGVVSEFKVGRIHMDASCTHCLTPEMVDLLLSLGAKPNDNTGRKSGETLWKHFLADMLNYFNPLHKREVFGTFDMGQDDYLLRASKVLQSLIRSGADIGSSFKGCAQSLSNVSIDSVIDIVFSLRLPEEATVLRELVQETRERRMRLELGEARNCPQEHDQDQPPSKRQEVTICEGMKDLSFQRQLTIRWPPNDVG